METPKPISLHVEAPLNQLSEVTTSYSQQVVDEYMNNPAAPIQKYRPQAIGYEGTYIPVWYRCDAPSRYWSVIGSNLNNRVRSNSFRATDPAEREIVIATEERLALIREIFFYLLSLKEAFKRLSDMEEKS